ncbi:MAG: AAA family ATPase [Armatimonadetes bacterium]|nr:AAA family ATPase [Armatimonadota bacterium]
MNTWVSACRAVIADLYKERINLVLGSELNELTSAFTPIWLTVSLEDFKTSASNSDTESAGLILDPEIGLLLCFIRFDASTKIRGQVNRVLKVRSYLRQDIIPDGGKAVDNLGNWQVAIHWLVPEEEKANWIDQIAELRHETRFSEEIAFDLITVKSDNVREALTTHVLPRLLLTTRSVARKLSNEATVEWMSADFQVKKALENFANGFEDNQLREYAGEVSKTIEKFESERDHSEEQANNFIKGLTTFSLRNFRNIKEVAFELGDKNSLIIHGPNGSGKSSLVEALSLATFKTSYRYSKFVGKAEKDVSARNKRDLYVTDYLTPIGIADPPQYQFETGDWKDFDLADPEQTEDLNSYLSGTVITQDNTLRLANLTKQELAVQVLGDFSSLSAAISERIEACVFDADEARKRVTSELGLRANTTNTDTVYARIVLQLLREQAPSNPTLVLQWLDEFPDYSSSRSLADPWRMWIEDDLNAVITRLERPRQNDTPQGSIVNWLDTYNRLVEDTEKVIVTIKERTSRQPDETNDIFHSLTLWANWLARHDRGDTEDNSERTELLGRQNLLQGQSRQLRQQVTEIDDRIAHLSGASAFVRSGWEASNPDTCPTCNSDLSKSGGILKVIEDVVETCQKIRQSLVQSEQGIRQELEETTSQLSVLGSSEPPVTETQREEVRGLLEWFAPRTLSFEEYIRVEGNADRLIDLYRRLSNPPTPPGKVNAQAITDAVIADADQRFASAERSFRSPENWKKVQSSLRSVLNNVVDAHLPNTLEKLWMEITLNLTPARWLLPDDLPKMKVTPGKNQAVSLEVNGKLARYILNQAEVHTLGLAWFFARHLTHGHFITDLMIMDDAAQEQDQTTFRDFCRFIECFTRIHRANERPIKLIATLNQESRALELARATRGMLKILDWESQQSDDIQTVDVIGGAFVAPSPVNWFSSSEST